MLCDLISKYGMYINTPVWPVFAIIWVWKEMMIVRVRYTQPDISATEEPLKLEQVSLGQRKFLQAQE